VQILAADLLNARRASIGSASPQDAAEGIAATARASLNVPMPAQLAWADQAGALNAWKVAVEGVGVLVLELRFAMRDARAFSLGDRRPPVVVLNSRDAGVAKPFSLFHEYGHLLLGEGGLCDLEDPGDGTQVHSIEAFCNRFAAAVLLPEEAFAAQMRVIGAQRPWSDDAIDKLAGRFKVSRHTVFVRMVTLGLATSADYRRRSAAWEADRAARVLRSGGRNVPAARCLRENGLTFTSAVLASEGSGRITRRDVADFLAVKVKYLGDVERRLSQAARTA
jgi:Zn-dependent peptidase ImmA (M78 family)